MLKVFHILSMDLMKSDMGGSAAVVGTMAAIAKANLNIHVIGLVPATDNRPSGNAYAPGDARVPKALGAYSRMGPIGKRRKSKKKS